MREDYYITSVNDMFVYLEVLRQFEPESVLDVGMFLKRTGALAKSIGDVDISNTFVFDGVDFAPQINAQVYRRVYDNIETWQDFKESIWQVADFSGGIADNSGSFKDKKYTLAVLMRCESFLDSEDLSRLFEWMSTHVEMVVISGKLEDLKIDRKKWQYVSEVETLKLEDDEYTIVCWNA
jgi:hypothetical protein